MAGFVPRLPEGDLYKYVIETADGKLLYKADPYGFYAEDIPGTASRLMDITGYTWHDGTWMNKRARHDHMKQPLNIYEVHLGSWRRHGNDPQGEPDENGNYPDRVIPSPRSAAPTTPTTTSPRSLWTTCATWATPTSSSCP